MKQSSSQHIYLNNAATSWPKAPGVADAVVDTIHSFPETPNRSTRQSVDIVSRCRSRLAQLLHTDNPNQIIFAGSCSIALNIAISGFSFKAGDHIVTTVAEHNSVIRPLKRLEKQSGVHITVVGFDERGRLDSESFNSGLAMNPRLVVINHASNVTGQVFDVAPLFHAAKDAGAATLLDASQTIGHIDVNPEKLAADLVAFPGHKGLLGPTGIGALYVSPHIELEPWIVGGTGVRSDLLEQPPEMPMRLEAGTPNHSGIAGLATALEWLTAHWRDHHHKQKILTTLLWDKLSRNRKVKLFGDSKNNIGIVSFILEGWSVPDIGFILEESFQIQCRTGLHCAPWMHSAIGSAPDGTVRFSVSGFNHESDIERAVSAINSITACK